MTDFPTHLFAFRAQRYNLVGRAITGGASISGDTQSVGISGGGRWVFEFGDASLNTREKLLQWRAWESELDDGVGTAIVPICDFRQAPVLEVGGKPYYGTPAPGAGVPHGPDDTLFSDEVGYQQTGLTATDITALDAAALRATTLRLQTVAGGPIRGGQHISITHEGPMGRRMYRTGRQVVEQAPGVYLVPIRPPLRAAIAADTVVDARSPSCLMKVASAGQMAPTVNSLKFATGAVTFVEAFPEGLT